MIECITNALYPPGTIGVIGGGQLGRMFVFEAKRMGYRVVVLDPKVNSPAGQVADEQIVGGFDDAWAYRELAQKSDVITFEFEHINVQLLALLEQAGSRVIPSSRTLAVIQNKYIQKVMLQRIGVKVPAFYKVESVDELKTAFFDLKQKAILKSCTDGYDGKGNVVVKEADDLEEAYGSLGRSDMLIEEWIDYTKEVSVIVVKSHTGVFFYPVVENIHHSSILIKTLVPAGISSDVSEKIQVASEKIVNELDDLGVYCIEFFVKPDGEVLVNEIAPRPHNSGHYTIEGCVTSQFEQLVRVVCGMPVGSTQLRMPCAMYNILGNQSVDGEYSVSGLEGLFHTPDCHFHLYGKSDTKNLKKIGHVTVCGETVDIADDRGRQALKNIRIHQK